LEPVHSFCLLEEKNDSGHRLLYDKIGSYAAENYAIIYAAELDTTATVRKMRQYGIDVEDLIESGILTLIDRDELYSVERTELDGHALMNAWHAQMLKLKKNSNFAGILALGSAENFLTQPQDHEKLVKYEQMIGTRFNIPFESVCCYSEKALESISLSNLFAILNAHYSTVHTSASRQWDPYEIIGISKKGIDSAFGGSEVADLFFNTLRLCYKLTEDHIVANPATLENLMVKVLGKESSDRCVASIKVELRNRLSVGSSGKPRSLID
jgi:hypothetical protein